MNAKTHASTEESPQRAAQFEPDRLYAEDADGNRLTDEEAAARTSDFCDEEDEEPTDYSRLLDCFQTTRNHEYAAEQLRKTRNRILGY